MKQYCTSEEDIETLFTYFQAAINGEENKELLKRLFDLQCGVMRSRPYRSERDTVLDDCCNIDLTEYTRGERESDEVGLCRGRECNYCGRYNAEPRQSKTDPVFISCNTPAHAFRLDLKNEQSELYCLWIEDDDGVYQTSCLHSFEFMDGTPERNGIKFCPYCGKELRQAGSP